ncbi:GAF domain-containing protein [Aerosakkonema sp. BLCC-F183]|uniref:GAF domain-containing sensor histidine kinase n=1 Tax=Aerosakkonema sp. BLCC-F183 TaxID=3342834 RepID=UPI0035BA3225
MKDSQDRKRLTINRKRGLAFQPPGKQGTHSPLSTSPLEVVRSSGRLNQHKQDLVATTNLERKITQIVLNKLDPEEVLPEIAATLGSAYGVEYCTIAVMASDRATIQTAYCYPNKIQAPFSQNPTLLLKYLNVAAILASSEPFAISDVGATGSAFSQNEGWEDLPSGVVLAMKTQFQGQVNGVVAIMRSKAHRWTASDKERLLAVSDSIAMAISQINLQRQIVAASGYQALLNQLTMAIRSYTDLEQILKLAIDGTARTLQVDRGAILLLKYTDPLVNKRGFQKRVSRATEATVVCEWPALTPTEGNQNVGTLLNQSFCLSKCYLCLEAFANAPNATVIADKHSVPNDDIGVGIAPIFDFDAMPALLLVPLESQDKVLGFLVLQQRQPRRWLREELDLVELVSAQMSTAILQFQTLRQTSALVEERTYQLQSILKVQAKLYEKTRQQVDQLRQLNQLKDEFIDTMSDQLRNPLASMRMAIRMLRQPGLSPDRQAKYLEILDRQCTQEINLIDDILALQQLESNKSPLHLQKIDLKQIVESLADSFAKKWGSKGLTLTLDLPKRPLMLQSDPDSVDRILQELLTNAGKYSDPDTTVHLCASHELDGQNPQIVLTLCNTGPGISPAEQDYIFDKFRRGQGVSEQVIQGTGLGLALVKCLVQHLNGTIAVCSNPLSHSQSWSTCFTLTLPQIQG